MRNYMDPQAWFRYLEQKRGSPPETIYFIYERAIKSVPGSYKLWKAYLDERSTACFQGLSLSGQTSSKADFDALNCLYESCLFYMSKMPRIWLDYISFLMRQRKISATRKAINRALQALPIGQHGRVWELALKFARQVEGLVPKTSVSIWNRHWQIASHRRFHEEYITILKRLKEYNRAAEVLMQLTEACKQANEEVQADEKWGQEYFWDELCSLMMQHGDKISSVDPEGILRVAIEAATVESSYAKLVQSSGKERPPVSCGVFWTGLAMLRIRKRDFDGARSVYEEAINAVPTIRDFSIVFDAYARFEESLLAAELERRRHQKSKGAANEGGLEELDSRLARLEDLFERRPFLIQEIRLKQQPHNIACWERLIGLYGDDQSRVAAYERALTSINPKKAKGDLPALWDSFARLFESLAISEDDNSEDHESSSGILESAVDIYEKAVASQFGSVEDQASMWIHYAEFLRRQKGGLEAAIDLLGRPTAPASGQVSRSPTLWNYLIDLEEARGTAPEAVKSAYERILSLGIATIQTIFNYADYLQDQGDIDLAFRVYERGIAMFGYPMAFDLWNVYLPKAVSHWAPQGKLERIRDLFEQALVGCPEKHLKPIYLMMAAFEESFGLSSGRNALRVLERACTSAPPEDKLELYKLFLQKTIALSGLVSARPVYEAALTAPGLQYPALTLLAQEYAQLEQRLGEDERCRAIFAHAGSLGDPRTVPALWQAWADFEVTRGDESTFREMLRVKRAAQAKFLTIPAAFVPATGNSDVVPEASTAVNEDEIQLDLE